MRLIASWLYSCRRRWEARLPLSAKGQVVEEQLDSAKQILRLEWGSGATKIERGLY